jgi:hypothetical protein
VNPAWIVGGLAVFLGALAALRTWMLGRRAASAHA